MDPMFTGSDLNYEIETPDSVWLMIRHMYAGKAAGQTIHNDIQSESLQPDMYYM